MGKISKEDKIRIQTLCEHGWGYKRIVSAYPNKWICWIFDSGPFQGHYQIKKILLLLLLLLFSY